MNESYLLCLLCYRWNTSNYFTHIKTHAVVSNPADKNKRIDEMFGVRVKRKDQSNKFLVPNKKQKSDDLDEDSDVDNQLLSLEDLEQAKAANVIAEKGKEKSDAGCDAGSSSTNTAGTGGESSNADSVAGNVESHFL